MGEYTLLCQWTVQAINVKFNKYQLSFRWQTSLNSPSVPQIKIPKMPKQHFLNEPSSSVVYQKIAECWETTYPKTESYMCSFIPLQVMNDWLHTSNWAFNWSFRLANDYFGKCGCHVVYMLCATEEAGIRWNNKYMFVFTLMASADLEFLSLKNSSFTHCASLSDSLPSALFLYIDRLWHFYTL